MIIAEQMQGLQKRQQPSLLGVNSVIAFEHNTADACENYFFCIFAQVSFKPTVRLKTILSAVESLSTQK